MTLSSFWLVICHRLIIPVVMSLVTICNVLVFAYTIYMIISHLRTVSCVLFARNILVIFFFSRNYSRPLNCQMYVFVSCSVKLLY